MDMKNALEAGSTVVVAVVAIAMATAYFLDRNAAPDVDYESSEVYRQLGG